MAKARARPLSTAEAVLAATFAYLVLLISLTGARIAREREEPVSELPAAIRVAQIRPVSALAVAGSCVGPRTVPYPYAAAAGVGEPLAFGPPVEPAGARSTAAVNGVL